MTKKLYTILIILILLSTTISISSGKDNNIIEKKNLPDSFSWKNIDGVDYTTPVKDQSPAPTCETYALCASLETLMQYQLQELYEPDLSECHLYFYADGTYEQGYVDLRDAADYLIEYGVPDEGCYPDPHRAFDYPFESLPGWENRTVKIKEWGWIELETEAIKSALIGYGPLVMCFSVYEDFYTYKGGVYRHETGKRVGGHVVTIVGYDDNEGCYMVKNSWGSGWGLGGYFKLAYDADLWAEWYGDGTGVMYIDGIYGNLKPDVPKVYYERPIYGHTYLFGFEFRTIFRSLPFQRPSARKFGELYAELETYNTIKVEFYVDDILRFTDEEAPYRWKIDASYGIHTLTVKAYNEHNASLDIVDFYVFF